jgi:hypothetical protein
LAYKCVWRVLCSGFLGFGRFLQVSALASHWLEIVQILRHNYIIFIPKARIQNKEEQANNENGS